MEQAAIGALVLRRALAAMMIVCLAVTGVLLTTRPAQATQKCNHWFYDGYGCQKIDDINCSFRSYCAGLKYIHALHTSRAVIDRMICDYDSYFWIDDSRGYSYDRYYHVSRHYGCSGPRAWFSWSVNMAVGNNSYGKAYWKDTRTGGSFRQITSQRIYR